MRKIIYFIITGTILTCGAYAQKWEVYSSANSPIPFNSIKALSIDSRGWIWLANENSGDCPHVGWFDGSAWNSYLTTDKVADVASDSKGDVYFSTSAREILRYHYGAWFTQGSVLLSSATIEPIFCDKNNVLWMGKTGSYNALIKYDGKNWREYSSANSKFPSSGIECIQDQATSLWVGTKEHGLVKLIDTVFTIYNSGNSILPESKISALASRKDTLWIFCGNKLINYKNTFNLIFEFPEDIDVIDMAIDNKGNIWLTSNIGLIKFNQKSYIIYNASNSHMPEGKITSLAIDKSNTIWVGTEAHGLISYNESRTSDIENRSDLNLNLSSYPNPFVQNLNINFYMHATGKVAYDLTDLQGKRIIVQNSETVLQGNHTCSITLPELSKGIYLLKVTTPNGTETLKLQN